MKKTSIPGHSEYSYGVDAGPRDVLIRYPEGVPRIELEEGIVCPEVNLAKGDANQW